MTEPLLWLIYLLTYQHTKRALLGSRRRFGVNVRFHWKRRKSNVNGNSARFQRLWN